MESPDLDLSQIVIHFLEFLYKEQKLIVLSQENLPILIDGLFFEDDLQRGQPRCLAFLRYFALAMTLNLNQLLNRDSNILSIENSRN